jgi:hypothetical protein
MRDYTREDRTLRNYSCETSDLYSEVLYVTLIIKIRILRLFYRNDSSGGCNSRVTSIDVAQQASTKHTVGYPYFTSYKHLNSVNGVYLLLYSLLCLTIA